MTQHDRLTTDICIKIIGIHDFIRIIETNSTIITTTPITKTGPISLSKKKLFFHCII